MRWTTKTTKFLSTNSCRTYETKQVRVVTVKSFASDLLKRHVRSKENWYRPARILNSRLHLTNLQVNLYHHWNKARTLHPDSHGYAKCHSIESNNLMEKAFIFIILASLQWALILPSPWCSNYSYAFCHGNNSVVKFAIATKCLQHGEI